MLFFALLNVDFVSSDALTVGKTEIRKYLTDLIAAGTDESMLYIYLQWF